MQDIRGDFLERWFIRKREGLVGQWAVIEGACLRGGKSERGHTQEEDFLTEGWCFFDSGLIIEGTLL